MKPKAYVVEQPKEENNVIFHKDAVDVTLEQMPYIIPASKSGSYSKLDKAKKKDEKKLIKEMKEYMKYDKN